MNKIDLLNYQNDLSLANSFPIKPLHNYVQELWTTNVVSKDIIHRFFDSYALDSTSSMVIYQSLPVKGEILSEEINLANISIADIKLNSLTTIDSTLAWSTQVGAHAQWDSLGNVYYNYLAFNSNLCVSNWYQNFPLSQDCLESIQVQGVKYNTKTKEKISLQCPIYHIRWDGAYSVSPNLLKIKHTQKGYGLDWLPLENNHMNSSDDGIYVNDLSTGNCFVLYTLSEIAQSIGIDVDLTPVYAFHTKWSSDGKYILLVLRTKASGKTMNWMSSTYKPIVRVQHLIILRFTLNPMEKMIRYILSWASKPFYDINSQRWITLRDGNHPNWIPNSHLISMNIEFEEGAIDDGIEVLDPETNRLMNENKEKKTLHKKQSKIHKSFSVVQINPFHQCKHTNTNDNHLQYELFHQNFIFSHILESNSSKIHEYSCRRHSSRSYLQLMVLWKRGMGHPTLSNNGRYILIDAYAKEVDLSIPRPISPIYLIDIHKQKAMKLLDVVISRQKLEKKYWIQDILLGGKEDRSRRCDIHPTWSHDNHYVVFNAYHDSNHRKVMMLQLNTSMLELD